MLPACQQHPDATCLQCHLLVHAHQPICGAQRHRQRHLHYQHPSGAPGTLSFYCTCSRKTLYPALVLSTCAFNQCSPWHTYNLLCPRGFSTTCTRAKLPLAQWATSITSSHAYRLLAPSHTVSRTGPQTGPFSWGQRAITAHPSQ